MLNFGGVSGGEIGERLRVELCHFFADLDFHHIVAKFFEAFAHFFRVRKLIEAGLPGIRDEGFVGDSRIGHVDKRQLEADFGSQLISFIAAAGVGRAGAVNLAFEFFLKSIAAELRFFFEQEPILAAEEIGGGESRDAATDDDDVGLARGVGAFELMAIANLVTDFEVFAVNERAAWSFRIRRGQKSFIDGAAGGDGTGDDELDEIAAGLRHTAS